jgi:plastocyanin
MIRITHAIAAFAIAAASSAFGAETVTVDITKFAFTPKEVTIKPGTTVVWVNHDEVPHTATSADKTLASKALDTDDRYEHTFDSEGDVAYFCAVHPFMTGVVHVHR